MAKYLTLTHPSGAVYYLMDSQVVRAVENPTSSSNVSIYTENKSYEATKTSFETAIQDSAVVTIPLNANTSNYINANRIVDVNNDNGDSVTTITFQNEFGQLETKTSSSTVTQVLDIVGLGIGLISGAIQVTAVGSDAATGVQAVSVITSNVRFTEFYGLLETAATGTDLFTVDILKNGTSILDDLITFDSGEATTENAATPFSFDTNGDFDEWDELTIEVTQVGDTTAGQGLSIGFKGYERG